MEEELKNYMIATFGVNAWNELLKIQGQIRKKRKLEEEYARKQREELMQAILIFFGIGIGGAFLIFAFVKIL